MISSTKRKPAGSMPPLPKPRRMSKDFKDDLLARRVDTVNLRLAGLQHGILVHLTDAESEQLHRVVPNLDGFALLGLYARGRAADLAAQCGQILRDTASTTEGSAS